MVTYTTDDIKRLVPEMANTVQAWLNSHIPAHKKAALIILDTRRQLEIAVEGLKEIAYRSEDFRWFANEYIEDIRAIGLKGE